MAAGDGGWPRPSVKETTGSTNDDVTALADAGAPEGTSVVAEQQTAGRGRQGREWVSPMGAGVWVSVLVRAGDVPKERWGWLSLVAGLAARDAIKEATGVKALLKWPNDVVVETAACGGSEGPRKLGGILSQVERDDAIAVGIGINVLMGSADLPVPQATSVFLEGGTCDREALLAALLSHLEVRIAQWHAGDPAFAHDYREACLTIGRLVDVLLPDGHRIEGVVTGIDADGHLKVMDGEIVSTVTAGDVIHASI